MMLICFQDSIFEEVHRTLCLNGAHQVVLPQIANLVLRLRVIRRPEIAYTQRGAVVQRDKDGVSRSLSRIWQIILVAVH